MSESYRVGDTFPLIFLVSDLTGDLADVADPDTITATLIHPDGSILELTLDHPDVGTYTADPIATQPGRYTARCVVTGELAGVIEDGFDVLPAALGNPSLSELRGYLGSTSATEADLRGALLAEQSAQRARCRIDPYTPDLHEALLRRVARNLAARRVPVATYTSFEGGGTSARVPSTDAEIRRLEAPYRRRVIG